jgi:hypothetical protein
MVCPGVRRSAVGGRVVAVRAGSAGTPSRLSPGGWVHSSSPFRRTGCCAGAGRPRRQGARRTGRPPLPVAQTAAYRRADVRARSGAGRPHARRQADRGDPRRPRGAGPAAGAGSPHRPGWTSRTATASASSGSTRPPRARSPPGRSPASSGPTGTCGSAPLASGTTAATGTPSTRTSPRAATGVQRADVVTHPRPAAPPRGRRDQRRRPRRPAGPRSPDG